MRYVLVTGGAGFIGSNVARAMASAGARVVISDRMRSGSKWTNLVDVGFHDLIVPDALPAWLAQNERNVEQVIHLGAVSSTSERDVDLIARENIRLSLDLWSWCTEHGTPFIYASSAATYGSGSIGFDDNDAPDWLAQLRPMNAYGWSKNVVDRRITADASMGRPTPPAWAGMKFFNVYGPGEDHKAGMRSLVAKTIPIAHAGKSIDLFRSYRPDFSDGAQCRDFVFIDDVVAVIVWAVEHLRVSGLYNVGSGKARTWNDLALAVFAALSRKPSIRYVDMNPEMQSHYQYFTEAPLGKLRSSGWSGSMTSLEEGVRRYVEAWLASERVSHP